MKFDQYTFVVGARYLSALITGDSSGLDEREERKLKRFEREHMQAGAHWAVGFELGCDACEVAGMQDHCFELLLMVPIEA